MLNLLPPEARQSLKKEYRLRVLALAFLFLAFSVGAGVVSVLPFAISAGSAYWFGGGSPLASTAETAQGKATAATLQDFKDTLSVLDPQKFSARRSVAGTIDAVVRDTPSGVRLRGFSFISGSGADMQLELAGVSDTRDSLVSFSQNLSNDPAFTAVNLPISNYSEKTNIDFSVDLTLATTTPE